MLEIPDNPDFLQCEPAQLSGAAREKWAFHFSHGNDPTRDLREITVHFADDGELLALAEMTSRRSGEFIIAETTVIAFRPDGSRWGKYAGFTQRFDEYLVSSKPLEEMPLPPGSFDQARELAAYLWKRRCST